MYLPKTSVHCLLRPSNFALSVARHILLLKSALNLSWAKTINILKRCLLIFLLMIRLLVKRCLLSPLLMIRLLENEAEEQDHPATFKRGVKSKASWERKSRRYTYKRKSTGDNTAEVEDEGDPMDVDEESEDDESAGKKRRKIKASQKF